MTRMTHRIDIALPADTLLAYAAAPTHWPQWHPSSLRIDGPSGPLKAGDHFEEDIHAGGRPGHLSWDVTDYQPGKRWQARASGDHGLRLLVTYECQAMPAGTLFIRTLEYDFPGWLMRLLDRLMMRRRVERESEDSLLALKRVAEQKLG